VTVCYHGTPVTPRAQLYRMTGQSFCVSFAEPRDADFCEAFGQSVLWDNGAFSAYTRGKPIVERDLFAWLEPRLRHPHRAVVLDEIGGGVDAQREMVRRWSFPRDLSWPVWHLDKPLDYLDELADAWPGVCLGSAGAYWQIGSEAWLRRMDEAFARLHRRRHLPWTHGLRMLGHIGSYPLASADSTNVAQNYGVATGCAHCHAKAVNSVRRKRGASKTPASGEMLFPSEAN
jgi:hypothetical protein